MLDLARVAGFEWDEGNERKSVDKHGISQAEAEQVFFCENLLVAEDVLHSAVEPRLHALGQTDDGRLLHVTFVVRQGGSRIRVISARPMSRKERSFYAETS